MWTGVIWSTDINLAKVYNSIDLALDDILANILSFTKITLVSCLDRYDK